MTSRESRDRNSEERERQLGTGKLVGRLSLWPVASHWSGAVVEVSLRVSFISSRSRAQHSSSSCYDNSPQPQAPSPADQRTSACSCNRNPGFRGFVPACRVYRTDCLCVCTLCCCCCYCCFCGRHSTLLPAIYPCRLFVHSSMGAVCAVGSSRQRAAPADSCDAVTVGGQPDGARWLAPCDPFPLSSCLACLPATAAAALADARFCARRSASAAFLSSDTAQNATSPVGCLSSSSPSRRLVSLLFPPFLPSRLPRPVAASLCVAALCVAVRGHQRLQCAD